jgi:hypothetical protein
MRTCPIRSRCRQALLAFGLAATASPLAAQSMSLKTVPIATGEQYLIYPARSLGMGGLSVAYDDPFQDPFVNPARGARLQGTWLLSSPTTYGDGDANTIGGHTLPLALTFGGARWFGTANVALQELATPDRQQFWWVPEPVDGSLLADDAATNAYLAGSIGRRFDADRTAVAVSAFQADLDAIDGVGRLYANSASLSQHGRITDLRLGVLRDLGGERRLEAMLSKSDVDMTHDVVYFEWRPWDPAIPNPPRVNVRTEKNRDRTTTWGGSLRYTAPTADPGVRFGLVLIGNTKSHPKIPNYDLVNIPRDPGNSTVFGLGAGITSQQGRTLLGAEVLLQPGRSHTWAFADSAIATPGGKLQKGDKTVDNEFRFANWTMALGLEHEWNPGGVQIGLRVNRYGYHLDQQNFLRDTTVATDEDWIEWSPGWGGFLKLGRAEVRYSGRWVAKGFDFPGGFWGTRAVAADAAAPGGNDFLVAPTSRVDLPDFRVVTHRVTVAVPLSRPRQ